MPKQTFHITNLTCEACVKMSAKALRTLKPVTDITIDLETGATQITTEEPINPKDIMEALQKKGYTVVF